MSLELHPNDARDAEALWKAWESSMDAAELEATFKVHGLTNWLDVVQHLRSLGLQENPQVPKLNILVGGGLRFTLIGEGVIQEFCKDNSLVGKPFHVVLKEKKRSASTDKTEVDWKEYGVRIKLRRELPLSNDDARVRDALSRWATLPKAFRYIKRYSYTSLNHKGLQFDLSVVKENRKSPRGDYIQATSFVTAEITKQPMHYEVEVEVLKGATLKSLMVGVGTVLRGLQRSFVLVRDSVKKSVLELIAKQTGAAFGSFPGPQPVILEHSNFAPDETDVPNIRRDDYFVTDKADGLRCLLVIAGNGAVFLVDTNLNVYGTDVRIAPKQIASEWAGTILDGEWVRRDANSSPVSRYYAFDILNGAGGEDVSSRPFLLRGADGIMGGNSRLAALSAAVGILSGAGIKTVSNIPTQHSLTIHMKSFHTPLTVGDPLAIFREASTILDRLKKDAPYHTDGLIFTPNAAPLPKNTGTWRAQFKWKPAEENTIDFLVTLEKELDLSGKPTAADLVSTKFRDDTNQIVRYKTLRLFVGSSTDPAFADPRATILEEKPLPHTFKRGEYKPVEFRPQPTDPMASVCYMAIDAGATDAAAAARSASDADALDDTIRCTRSGDPITSRCVVEMAYHPHRPAGWRWEPIRVRWDKTERFQRGIMERTMNSDWVAQATWASIHSPITEHMVRTGSLEESEEETAAAAASRQVTSTAYYIRKAPERNLFNVRGLRDFHNHYIKDSILMKPLKKGNALYDMTCGQAGDMHKWHSHRAGWVLGTDIAEQGLIDNRDGAYRRYMDQLIRQKGAYTPMIFVQANVSERLADGGAGQTPIDRAILRTLWGADEPEVPPYARKFRGRAADGFDVVSCMFSLHYFFKDSATLDGWLQNVSDTLKVNGYFVGCCFDGEAVSSLLSGLPVDGVKRGVEGDVDVWSIAKRYESDELIAGPDGLGKAIDVSFISIGETYTEYLVSWPYLQQRLGEIGLELLNADELSDMGLLNSSNLFSESYDMATLLNMRYAMSPVIKQFSFLNRWFIFRRRSMGVGRSRVAQVSRPPAIVEPPVNEEETQMPPLKIRVEEVVEAVPETVSNAAMLEEVDLDEFGEPVLEESLAEESVAAAAEPEALKVATGPVYKFYHSSVQKDELGIKDKNWKRYISPFTLFPLTDREDPTVVYPSLEAAFSAEKYKVASDKPALGPKLFSETGDIHQKYEALRYEKGASIPEKEAHELTEKEGDEMRKGGKAPEMKKVGAKLNDAAWKEQQSAVIYEYVKQRFQKDSRFREILEKVKEKDGRLVYYISASPNEFSGVEKDGVIVGENLVGKAMMSMVGLTY